MKVRVNLYELYSHGDELTITLALLYRLAKLGSEAAKEKFKVLLSDEDFFEQALIAESDDQGDVFILACDLLSFDEFVEIYERIAASHDDEQTLIEDLVDACPPSFVREHREFFDEKYDWLADSESVIDFLRDEDLGDGIFDYVDDTTEPFRELLPIVQAVTTIKLKNNFMDPDYLPTGLAMYARYLDAKCGWQEARSSFIELCSDPSYIEFLCDTYGIFDLMLDLLNPEEIIRILSAWEKSRAAISFGKGTPAINCGETLYVAFLEQEEGQKFYSEYAELFEENGLENPVD